MIQLILALLLGFQTIPQPGGFDMLIQFRLSEPARTDTMCEAPLGFGFETVIETAGNVNVRALPTANSERVGGIVNGSVVYIHPPVWGQVVGGSDLWYPLRDEQDAWRGYVAGALVTAPEFTWGC